jgi:hypothetical protein
LEELSKEITCILIFMAFQVSMILPLSLLEQE